MYVSQKESTDRGGHVGPSPGQMDLEGGRPAPLWSQIVTTLVGTDAKRWERKNRPCDVSLAKKYGRMATWWLPGHILS
jgi:hypothetical protein